MKKIYTVILLAIASLAMFSGCENAVETHVEHSPELVSIIPKAGYAGTEAVISGWWFSENPDVVSVEIGGTKAEVTSSAMDRIRIVMPDKPLGSYSVKVSVNGLEAEGLSFRYAEVIEPEQLAVYSYIPASGIEGDEITISGVCFSGKAERNTVTINGKSAQIVSVSGTKLTVILPDNPEGQYPFIVTVGEEAAEGPVFTYLKKPELTVTSILPNSGTAGDKVVISGLCFSTVPSENIVKFGEAEAEVVSASAQELAVIVPENPVGNYTTSVTVGDKTVEGPVFAYIRLALRYVVKTVSGSSGRAPDATSPVDGGPSAARWRNPRGMCFLPDGRLAVAESGQNLLRFMTVSDYTVTTTTTGRSLLNAPWFMCQNGNWLYVASKGNGKVIRYDYVNDKAEELVSSFTGKSPMDVRFDAAGNAYVAVRDNKAIYRYPGGDFTQQETFVTLNDGPLAMEFDSEGNLIVCTNGCQLIKVTPSGKAAAIAGIRTAKAGDPGTPGQPLTAKFGSNLYGLAIDAEDNIYFTDQSPNHVVWLLTRGEKGYEDATISVAFGTLSSSGTADGTGTEAKLNCPCDIIFSPSGDRMYLTEDNANFRIREIAIEHVRE